MPNSKKQAATTASPTPTDKYEMLLQQFQKVEAVLPIMEQKVAQAEQLLHENIDLKKQLTAALIELAQLKKAQMQQQQQPQQQQPPQAVSTSTNTEPTKISVDMSTQTPPFETIPPAATTSPRKWTDAVKQNLPQNPKKVQTQKIQKQKTTPPSPPTEGMLNWAYRGFMEDNGPKGYQFIHFKTPTRTNQRTVRKRLAILGISNRRVLAVQFPTKGVVAILVHNSYAEEIKTIFARTKVTPYEFNPHDESVICDPQHASLSVSQKRQMATNIYHTRMVKLCLRMQSPHVGFSIIKHFNHVDGNFHLPDAIVKKYNTQQKSGTQTTTASPPQNPDDDPDEDIPDAF